MSENLTLAYFCFSAAVLLLTLILIYYFTERRQNQAYNRFVHQRQQHHAENRRNPPKGFTIKSGPLYAEICYKTKKVCPHDCFGFCLDEMQERYKN